MMPIFKPGCGRNQHGFTLLEILVAIVVLSIGLLGLAGLQAASLNNNQTAYYRSIASQQAYDMADRMRANLGELDKGGVRDGDYDNLTATMPEDPACIATGTSGCADASDVAITDQFQWLTSTAALLPGGAGTVRCAIGPAATCVTETPNSNRMFDITVTWTEKGAVFDDPNCPAGTESNTRCFITRFAP